LSEKEIISSFAPRNDLDSIILGHFCITPKCTKCPEGRDLLEKRFAGKCKHSSDR
jgi:hypothetical protein